MMLLSSKMGEGMVFSPSFHSLVQLILQLPPPQLILPFRIELEEDPLRSQYGKARFR